jgi:hypothetical protein
MDTHTLVWCAFACVDTGQYIFQASVDPPQRFYRDLDQRGIKFGLSRPDLLRVIAAPSSPLAEPKRALVIIDAKSSAKTKFSQQVQVRALSRTLT